MQTIILFISSLALIASTTTVAPYDPTSEAARLLKGSYIPTSHYFRTKIISDPIETLLLMFCYTTGIHTKLNPEFADLITQKC